MAKKGLLALVLAAFVAGGVFAQDIRFSAGGGFIFDGGRVGGIGFEDRDEWTGGWEEWEDLMFVRHSGFGGFVFLDATFAELAISFMGGPAVFGGRGSWSDSDGDSGTWHEGMFGSFLALDFSLLGRFPVAVGDGNLSIFPLLGIGFNVVLASRDANGDGIFDEMGYYDEFDHGPTSLSTFRIQFGAGADIDIADNVFLRIQGLAHYRFPASFFNDTDLWGNDANPRGGFGGTAKIGIGFRF
ncbi:MAG: hypothetical protein FWD88_01365 [Treponema sp.]|nr:hypothetical protein [Treponema sp.]